MNVLHLPTGGKANMQGSPDALLCTCALSLMSGRTRREWNTTLQTLELIDVTWRDLAPMPAMDAWKWLGWDAVRFREWQSALEVARLKLRRADSSSIDVVTGLDPNAPEWLRTLPSVPWLFYRGDLAILDRRTLGFSGQREGGDGSLKITRDLAREAAHADFTVVSGVARGIDLTAHLAALESGGTTVVVLPQGLLTWRPNHELTRNNVLAVSEDLPWEDWTTESAMRRNRMIVDLSHVFVVPQAGESGGSHSTGRYALRQGKVAFVPNLGPAFPGNQKLLQHGARKLVSINGSYDLEQMRVESVPVKTETQQSLF